MNLLRQLDRWRSWQSLEERRLCLGCGRIITGNEIVQTADHADAVDSVRCPTPGCESIPLDWILPESRDRTSQA